MPIIYHDDPELAYCLLTYQHRREAGEDVSILLAEGDSWFSFGGATGNLLMALDDDKRLIVSCAYPGDTLRNISDMNNDAFKRMLTVKYGFKWDAILLSAGGNDVIDSIGDFVFKTGEFDFVSFALKMLDIKRWYRNVITDIRKEQDCPIVCHTYDHITPDTNGGYLRAGPWIGKKASKQITNRIIDELADTLMSMEPLTVIDTRGTLESKVWRKWGWQKHFKNEIHPTVLGYKLLIDKWLSEAHTFGIKI